MSDNNFMADVNKRANLAFSNEMEMLTFLLTDGQLYGLNVFKIIEILECPKTVVRIPQSHPAIKGTIDFRGHAINLLDLSEALGLEPMPFRERVSYVLVCEYSTSIQGFLVSEPDRLIQKSWSDIIRPDGSLYDSSYLTAITHDNDRTIQILDVEKVLMDIIGIENEISEEITERAKRLKIENYHILAVDDSNAARMLMASAFKQIGLRHTLFDAADKALDELESTSNKNNYPYNLIFSDIEMPIMDGFTFARKVKQNPKLAHIYLALHSSLSNKSNQDKAAQMGANDFIPKFQPNKIAVAILDQIEKASLASQP
ncbi:MAG: chemotaxis protein CheV [Magnetococcales bacterium]|nr:chemotaxis protein CheV [Magnetococcales bacterium]MBF0439894.1 chemotaxis protein CheV [Magnetococcales bacterium]